MAKSTKTAVVLFNLGGPDRLQAVKPFLYNLFNDPAIIRIPYPFRPALARFISAKRAGTAAAMYEKLGGKSPIVEQTQAQCDALQKKLSESGDYKVFASQRYWHPFSAQVVHEVKNYAPDRVVLLPLYPQFSTTTTASSLKDWMRHASDIGLSAPTHSICCYPVEPHFISSHLRQLRQAYFRASGIGSTRILFSAHGLPEKIIKSGDPYKWQIEQSAHAIAHVMNIENLDYSICYQSRVGPLKWIGPSTEDEIARAGAEGKSLVVVPIAFVSEHLETLVELDIEYAELAKKKNVPYYVRVPALQTETLFVESLAALVQRALDEGEGISSYTGSRICPMTCGGCPNQKGLPG